MVRLLHTGCRETGAVPHDQGARCGTRSTPLGESWARAGRRRPTSAIAAVAALTNTGQSYGLSLRHVVLLTGDDGGRHVLARSGLRTIRVAVHDETYTHQEHEGLHGTLARIGVLAESRGHAPRPGEQGQ